MIKKIIFTDEQIRELKKEKEYNPIPYVRRRCEAVWLKSQGFKNKEIEKIVGITHGTVSNYLKLYRNGYIQALKSIHYKGQPGRLHAYSGQIKDSPEKQPVSPINEAKARIKEITGSELSLTQVKYFMDNLGFKRRKVKQISDKADAEKQEIFKKKELEPLIEKAVNKEIYLFFADAAHFVLRPFLGFIYCLASVFIKSSAGRKRYNVLGAVNAITKEITAVTNSDYINSFSVCELMDTLKIQYIDLPIYIIFDNARYQKNHFVMNYAESLGITLIRLPPYSPNLNLIERFWKFIKKKVLYNVYYKDFSGFVNAVNRCISKSNSEYKEEMNSLLTLNFQHFNNTKIKP